MTEYTHLPIISCVKTYRLSPSQVNLVICGVELVLNREELRKVMDAMARAFDEGPQIVCEVVEQVKL